MNKTDKATLEAAKRMIKGGIDLEEVSMLLNLPMEKLVPIKEEIDEAIRKVYGNLDNYDFTKETILFDNYDDTGLNEDIPANMPGDDEI